MSGRRGWAKFSWFHQWIWYANEGPWLWIDLGAVPSRISQLKIELNRSESAKLAQISYKQMVMGRLWSEVTDQPETIDGWHRVLHWVAATGADSSLSS